MTMTIKSARRGIVRKLVPLMLAACFAPALAEPKLPQVVNGQASFAQQGNVFSITNTPNTIINWQSFSVEAGEVTRFIQQSSSSAVLNRIVGQDPSRILGALQSNGQVFLINPNGIMFGRESRVDVNGLTASTLNLSNPDFLAGKRNFSGAPNAGAIVNQGAISTPGGGHVYLIAPSVTNNGVITSPQGDVVLAAGHSVQLVDSANPDLHVVVSAPASQALNLGQVIAHGGRVGIYGALVRQRGVVNADSAQVGANGRIVFKASGDALLEAGSVSSATGAGNGGAIHVLGERVGITGDARIDASGRQGGGSVLVGGDYQGGNPLLPNAQQTLFGPQAVIQADAGANGNGGKVVLWSDGVTRAFGRISARGGAAAGNGGLVETSGHQLDVNGLLVDAGGAKGRSGTWLLDPYNVIIETSGTTPLAAVDAFTDGASNGDTYVHPNLISNAGNGTDVLVQATNDITIRDPIARTSGTTGALTLQARNNIVIYATVDTGGGPLTLQADADDLLGGSLNFNAAVMTRGGLFKASANQIIVDTPGSVNSGTGSIDFRASDRFNMIAGSSIVSSDFIDIQADAFSLLGSAGSIGGVASTLPIVSIAPYTAGKNIYLVNGVSGFPNNVDISPSQLQNISAFQLSIGNSAHTGNISVLDAYTPGVSARLALETQGDILVSEALTLPAANSSYLLLGRYGGSGTVSTSGNGSVSADQVMIRSDNMALGAALNASGADGSVTLMPNTAAGRISLGNGALDESGQLGLDSAELAFVSSKNLTIGGQPNQWGHVYLAGDLIMAPALGASHTLSLMAGEANMVLGSTNTPAVLNTPGALKLSGANLSTGTGPVTAASISIMAMDGIGAALTPFETKTPRLNANNDAPGGTAPININNAVALQLGGVSQTGVGNTGWLTVANSGGMIVESVDPISGAASSVSTSTGGGPIYLKTASPLTVKTAVTSSTGAIRIEAGNSGALALTANASVTTAGDIFLIGGSVSNLGTVTSSGGNVTVTGTYSGAGLITAPLGTVSGLAPTLTVCLTTPSTSGCTGVLAAALTACIANPGGTNCGAVLPTVTACTASPSTPGCSVVLPTLSACIAAPATAGCSVILPTITTCIAAPSTAGCSAVLPSPTTCAAAPSTPGCAVPQPTLSQCIAAPSTAGCSAVLPTLNACTALPSTTGCSVVLPSLPACVAAPATLGCSAVLPTLSVCTSSPSTPGCGAVLPTLSVCTSLPSTPGCSVVLPTLSACIALPSTPGCGAVLPTLSACTSLPSTPGCGAVLPTLTVCSAAPATAGCSVVLPSLATCTAAPSTPGCSVVLPPPTTCSTAPTSPGCATAPTLAACIAAPATAGCSAVLPNLAACTAAPTMAGCSVVLPNLAACTAAPTTAGCAVVLPALNVCIATPSSAGCSAVLPTLSACTATPAAPGCAVVLPSLTMCVASPNRPGCSVVLPLIEACVLNAVAPGCSVVLPTLSACTVTPSLQGCTVVLPSLNQCITTPTQPGCAATLPTLSQCTEAPTRTGCTVVLPTLAQCTASPSLQGCAVVVPPVSNCAANPSAAGCPVVVAPPQRPVPGNTVQQALNNNVNVINTVTNAVSQPGGGGSTPADTKKNDGNTVANLFKPEGDSGEKRKKTYCN